METYRKDHFSEIGLPSEFVQDNHSRSVKNVLRGLHFQWEPPMGKLMRVTYGSAFLVAVDIRKGSPTVGEWFGLEAPQKTRNRFGRPQASPGDFVSCLISQRFNINAPAFITAGQNQGFME